MSIQVSNFHNACRNKVCLVCSRRSTRCKPLSKNEVDAIHKFIDEDYNTLDPYSPNTFCNGCYLLVHKKMKDENVQIEINQTYKSGDRSLYLRSAGSRCQCTICKIATWDCNQIRASKKKLGRPKTISSTTPEPGTSYKVCAICMQKLYQGCRHRCSINRYRRSKVNNVEKLIASPTTANVLAARTISRSSSIGYLSTMGRNKRMIPNTSKQTPRKLFSVDDMCLIRKDLNLSTRQTLTLAHDIRMVTSSSRSIESSLKQKMHDKCHELDHFFEHRMITFTRDIEVKGKKYADHFEQHVITTTEISGFINNVMLHRNINEENLIVRIGLDGGGGFLKVCLSLYDLDETSVTSEKALSKKYKDSGVKKVFIIGLTPDVPEKYVNVKKLWLSMGLQSLERSFTIATDLKLCNILLGLMSHSSLHPCCWCNVGKTELQKKGEQRTFGSLNDLFWNYFDARVPQSKAKNYGNVIHPAIIDNIDEATPVITIVPPPELHLLLGPVNHMYDEMNKVWPDSDLWLKSCFVKKSDYHGGAFEGNDCRKLLRKIDSLIELCPQEHQTFVHAFSSFDAVVSSCYGSNLKPDYKEKISKFKQDYLKLNITVTPKVHAVMYHIEEFCQLTGMSLGPFSEQTSESLHHEFTKCWEKYKIKDTSHPLYGEKLLQSVQMFNSLNL